MTETILHRMMMIRLVLLFVLIELSVAHRAFSDETVARPSEWSLGADIGVVDFVSPKRSAATVSDPTLGGAIGLFVLQRPLSFLAIGCRAELLILPSREPDADATFGGRGTLMLRFILPLRRFALHLTPEAGYAYLGRRVDFDNTDRVSFQGPAVGLAAGSSLFLGRRTTLGVAVRVSHILGSLACTATRCQSPQKGRSPGPAIWVGVSGAFAL